MLKASGDAKWSGKVGEGFHYCTILNFIWTFIIVQFRIFTYLYLNDGLRGYTLHQAVITL